MRSGRRASESPPWFGDRVPHEDGPPRARPHAIAWHAGGGSGRCIQRTADVVAAGCDGEGENRPPHGESHLARLSGRPCAVQVRREEPAASRTTKSVHGATLAQLPRSRRSSRRQAGRASAPWVVSSSQTWNATEEQGHADRIAARIVQLLGEPDFNPATLLSRGHSEYAPANDLVDMIKEDLVGERVASPRTRRSSAGGPMPTPRPAGCWRTSWPSKRSTPTTC